MRTLLTYFLAAFAAAAVLSSVSLFATASELRVALSGESLDPSVVAGLISQGVVSFALFFAVTLTVWSLLWAMSGFVSRIDLGFAPALVRGAVVFTLCGLAFAAAIQFYLIANDPEIAVSGLQSMVTRIWLGLRHELAFLAGLLAVAGAAWGTVFWLRAPKAGEALA